MLVIFEMRAVAEIRLLSAGLYKERAVNQPILSRRSNFGRVSSSSSKCFLRYAFLRRRPIVRLLFRLLYCSTVYCILLPVIFFGCVCVQSTSLYSAYVCCGDFCSTPSFEQRCPCVCVCVHAYVLVLALARVRLFLDTLKTTTTTTI